MSAVALCCVLFLGARTGSGPAGLAPTDASTKASYPVPSPRPLSSIAADPFRQDEDLRDAWLGVDKLKHLTASFAAVGMGYGGFRAIGLEHGAASIAALAGAGTVGVLKELYDRSRARPFSFRDLSWDAVGVLAGAALVDRIR